MSKNLFYFSLLFIIFSCKKEKEPAYLSKAKAFQYKMNVEFSDKQTSPLTKADFVSFTHLDFFPIQEKYSVKAHFTPLEHQEPFEMLTTTSRLAKYIKYGMADFILDNKKLSLTIYQSVDDKKHLFLPYFDETSGKDSYSGGKYIELEPPVNNIIIIDFNQAYNPYCAYNHKYSCPIPPDENRLNVAIRAGVKAYIHNYK